MRRFAVVVLSGLASLAVVSCGDDSSETSTTTPDTTTTTLAATTTTAVTDLPGERVEIYPYEGAALAVVGVASDDTLNVRIGPGVEFSELAELAPLADGIVATGHNRSLGEDGFWSEITADGQTGWVNTAFVAQPGQTVDATSRLFPTPADRPSAASMADLADTVARLVASTEPPSRIVVVASPAPAGDVSEVMVDVIGLGDDAVSGERLHVFADRAADGNSFTVRSVESTVLCARGVADGGLCV
jgi:hypothetical protein